MSKKIVNDQHYEEKLLQNALKADTDFHHWSLLLLKKQLQISIDTFSLKFVYYGKNDLDTEIRFNMSLLKKVISIVIFVFI